MCIPVDVASRSLIFQAFLHHFNICLRQRSVQRRVVASRGLITGLPLKGGGLEWRSGRGRHSICISNSFAEWEGVMEEGYDTTRRSDEG